MAVFLVPSAMIYVLCLFFPDLAVRSTPQFPRWALPVYLLGCIAQIVFLIAIWRWKRWGFHAFVILAVPIGAFNALVQQSTLKLIYIPFAILVLYGVLQIGTPEKKGWRQLE